MSGFLQSDSEEAAVQQSRWPGLVISVCLHGLLLSTAPFWSTLSMDLDSILRNSVEEAIETNRRNTRLIWYKLPTPPSIRNPEELADRKRSSGETASKTEIVATQPDAQSNTQLIYRAVAKEIKTEVQPLENLVARSPAPESQAIQQRRKAPLPEAPRRADAVTQNLERPPELTQSTQALALQTELARLPKPPPKKFVAPATANSPTQAARADFGALPELQSGTNPSQPLNSLTLARLPKPAAKKFTAPSPNGTQSGAARTTVDFGSIPELSSAAQGDVGSAGQIPKLARRKLQAGDLLGNPATGAARGQTEQSRSLEAPPELQGPGGSGQGGKAQADLVVLSLNPGKTMAPPDTRMSGSFSRASESGPPAHTGNTDRNAIAIPGVSTRPLSGPGQDFRLQTPEQILGAEAADGYFEVKLELAKLFPKLSVPIAPSRRMLPQRIEPYFRGRSVFALAVPIEKMDRYGGDWILWFAPKPVSGEVPVALEGNIKMETPLPFWKLESRRWLVSGGERGVEQRVLLAVEISRDGRVRVKELMSRFGSAMSQMVTNDISRWVFHPARLNGRAIDVDAVVEIPFRVPETLAGMP